MTPTTAAPRWVALARGLLEAAVLAVLGVLIVAVSEIDAGALAPWAPIGLLILRQLEGLADEHIDPSTPRGPVGRTLAGTTAQRPPSTRGQSIPLVPVLLVVIIVILLVALL